MRSGMPIIISISMSDQYFRVATVSLMIAFKYYCETCELVRNSDFSRLIGVESNKLMEMEIAFFGMLDY